MNTKSKRIFLAVAAFFFFAAVCNSCLAGTSSNNAKWCCSLLSTDEAAKIIGIPQKAVRANGYLLPVSPEEIKKGIYRMPPCGCGFRDSSSFLRAISYRVYVFDDEKRAKKDFQTMKQHFQAATSVKDVSGLGEKAFRVDDSRFHRTVALRKGFMVDVINPREEARQRSIVSAVLANVSKR